MSDSTPSPLTVRTLVTPALARGMRLDRFLARRFSDFSRSELSSWIRQGMVRDGAGRVLRASSSLKGEEILQVSIPGIAPDSPPPPLPAVLHEDERLVVLDKPAGLLVHPTGTAFAWAVIGLARERWPGADIVHRLDRDTSGVLVLSKDAEANRMLKAAFSGRTVRKRYEALVRGHLAEDYYDVRAAIGAADGPIRIQMAVRDDGLPARTELHVLARGGNETCPMSRVRCTLHTGRTHQIRVHCAHVGQGLVGDRMYGVPPAVFLRAWEHGVDAQVLREAGAPRHALHAASIAFVHPDGHELEVEAPWPTDLDRWWHHPECLPLDGFGDDSGA